MSTANLVLQDTIERIFAKDIYADIQRGIFLVRGENVLMLGEIVCSPCCGVTISDGRSRTALQDLDKEEYIPEPFRKASPNEVHAATVMESRARKHSDKVRQSKLQELGFEVEHTGEVLL